MSTSTITVRVDTDLKNEASALFTELGLTTSTAITAFLRAAVSTGSIPFEIKKAETLAAATAETETANADSSAGTESPAADADENTGAEIADSDNVTGVGTLSEAIGTEPRHPVPLTPPRPPRPPRPPKL